MWVSTGNVGIEAQNSRTTSAVFGPTPGSSMSAERAASRPIENTRDRSPPYLSSTARAIPLMFLALARCMPAGLTASSSASSGAPASDPGETPISLSRLRKAR
jgi:hypothetical protein